MFVQLEVFYIPPISYFSGLKIEVLPEIMGGCACIALMLGIALCGGMQKCVLISLRSQKKTVKKNQFKMCASQIRAGNRVNIINS